MTFIAALDAPIDRVVGQALVAMGALWAGGTIAFALGAWLAWLDRGDRETLRAAVEGATEALTAATTGPATANEKEKDAVSLAGTVEFVRAIGGPADSVLRRSRAVVALVVGGILFVAGGLVPLFETALVSSYCGGEVAPASSPSAGSAPAGTPAPEAGDDASNGDEDATAVLASFQGKKQKDKDKDKDKKKNRPTPAPSPAPVRPRLLTPPGC